MPKKRISLRPNILDKSIRPAMRHCSSGLTAYTMQVVHPVWALLLSRSFVDGSNTPSCTEHRGFRTTNVDRFINDDLTWK
jgi:hypothetical protein